MTYRFCPGCGVKWLPGNNWPHGPEISFYKGCADNAQELRVMKCCECDNTFIITLEAATATIRYLDSAKYATEAPACPECDSTQKHAARCSHGGPIHTGPGKLHMKDIGGEIIDKPVVCCPTCGVDLDTPGAHIPKPAAEQSHIDEIRELDPNCAGCIGIEPYIHTCAAYRGMTYGEEPKPCTPKPDRIAELREKWSGPFEEPVKVMAEPEDDREEPVDIPILKCELQAMDKCRAGAQLDINELLEMLEAKSKEFRWLHSKSAKALAANGMEIGELKIELAAKGGFCDSEQIAQLRAEIKDLRAEIDDLYKDIRRRTLKLKAKDADIVRANTLIEQLEAENIRIKLEAKDKPSPRGQLYRDTTEAQWDLLLSDYWDQQDEIKELKAELAAKDKEVKAGLSFNAIQFKIHGVELSNLKAALAKKGKIKLKPHMLIPSTERDGKYWVLLDDLQKIMEYDDIAR